MRALALLALCLPAAAIAGAPTDKYEGSVGEVQIEGVVELPLLSGLYGDELPYVMVNFGEDDLGAWPFLLSTAQPDFDVATSVAEDFGSGVKTKNKKFFASLGKKKDEAAYKLGGKAQVTTLDELFVGEGLVLGDMDAAVGSFESAPLMMGSPSVQSVFGGLGIASTIGLPFAILPSEGVVRVAPADQGQLILDMVGGTVLPYTVAESSVEKAWSGKQVLPNYSLVVEGEINGQPVKLAIATGRFGTRIGDEIELGDGPTVPMGDFDLHHLPITLGGLVLEASWIQQRDVDILEHPAGVNGILGYGFLADYDIAIDPASQQIALRLATAQQRAWPAQAFIDAKLADLEPEEAEEGADEKTEEDIKAEQDTRAGELQDLGYLYLVANQVEPAIATYEEATGLDADPCEYWGNLADAYARAHRFDDAAVAAQKSLDRYAAWASLSTEEREEIEEMDDEEREASGVQPQDLDACFEAAGQVAYYQLVAGENAQAIATYGEHVDLHPNLGVVAGVAYLLEGDDDAAQGPLRHVLNMGARDLGSHQGLLIAARIALAELYQRSGDFDVAIAHWERERSFLSGDPFAVQQYADLIAKRDGADAAIPALQALSDGMPDNPVSLVVLGNELAAAGKADDATAAYDKALALIDHNLSLRPNIAALYGLKAWTLVQREDWEGAKEAAKAGLERNPTEGYSNWAMIKVAEIERKMPMALKHYKLAKAHHMGHYFFATLPAPKLKITAQAIKITETALNIPEKVYFQTGKAIIDQRSYELLDAIAQVLTEHPELLQVSVEGHTDSTGDDKANKKLSQARAEAVVAYLVEKGIDAERLAAKGWGEEKPVGSNDTDEGKASNRRVEFLITKK